MQLNNYITKNCKYARYVLQERQLNTYQLYSFRFIGSIARLKAKINFAAIFVGIFYFYCDLQTNTLKTNEVNNITCTFLEWTLEKVCLIRKVIKIGIPKT